MAKLESMGRSRIQPGLSERTNRAYVALKEAILSLELEPGSVLFEDELAEQLGLSKTPVREALQELERDGLVTRIPYKGTYVTEITEEDLQEIIQLKAVLEGLAGRLSVGKFSPEDLDKAERFLGESDDALQRGDIDRALQLGNEFHDFVLHRASNRRLLHLLNILDDQVHRLRHMATHSFERMKQSSVEHRKILEAVRRGDADAVEEAFRHHLHSFLNDVKRSTSSSGRVRVIHHESRHEGEPQAQQQSESKNSDMQGPPTY